MSENGPPTESSKPLADAEWRLVTEQAHDGPMQMALDEIAAETAAAGGPRTVRVYRWEPSTLSLGYHQDPATVDWDFCEREGITVTRRQTGGGAIYHDSYGDISYAIVAPADELPGDLMESYSLLCTPLLDALDRMGVPADFAREESPAIHQPACYLRQLHPAHDVVTDDGRKVSGNAQYRQKDAVIQHGSLTYDRAVARHLGCFDADLSTAAFRERVSAVTDFADIDRREAVGLLEAALADWTDAVVDDWTDEELSRARQRAREKYDRESWVREGELAVDESI